MCLYSVESTSVFLFDHELLVLSRYEAVKQVLVANSSQGAHERQIHICRHELLSSCICVALRSERDGCCVS